jgi:hypothetical protein
MAHVAAWSVVTFPMSGEFPGKLGGERDQGLEQQNSLPFEQKAEVITRRFKRNVRHGYPCLTLERQ